jgi:hypothetical protein
MRVNIRLIATSSLLSAFFVSVGYAQDVIAAMVAKKPAYV